MRISKLAATAAVVASWAAQPALVHAYQFTEVSYTIHSGVSPALPTPAYTTDFRIGLGDDPGLLTLSSGTVTLAVPEVIARVSSTAKAGVRANDPDAPFEVGVSASVKLNRVLATTTDTSVGAHPLFVSYTSVSARWIDTLVLNWEGSDTGDSYTASSFLNLGGQFFGGGSTVAGGFGSRAYVDATLRLFGSLDDPAAAGGRYMSSVGGGDGGITSIVKDPQRQIPVSWVVNRGQPTTISFLMLLAIEARVDIDYTLGVPGDYASVDFNADFSRTLSWGGPITLTDSRGNLVEGWTMTSASGANYMGTPIPEPSTFLLLGLGLAGLHAQRGRG